MHRHGYSGRKLGRERDERRLLVKNLATSLVLEEHITTTLPKAKEVVPYVEKLISKAMKGGLHQRRQILAGLLRDDAANKLVDTIAPQMKRDSGFLKLKRAGWRRGDHTELAQVTFVDELKVESRDKVPESKEKPTTSDSAKPAKKATQKKPTTSSQKPTAKSGAKK